MYSILQSKEKKKRKKKQKKKETNNPPHTLLGHVLSYPKVDI